MTSPHSRSSFARLGSVFALSALLLSGCASAGTDLPDVVALATGSSETSAAPTPASPSGTIPLGLAPTGTTPATPGVNATAPGRGTHTNKQGTGKGKTKPSKDKRPNIVFITTDDMTVSDLKWMPRTRRLIAGNGVNFVEGLSPHPLCCPARAEYVSGQYGQNNGVHHNKGRYGGYPALRDPSNTVGRWMHRQGYLTAMTGKYMNGYSVDRASRMGWNHWNPTVKGIYTYTNTTFYDDGQYTHPGGNVDDAVMDFTSQYIREFSEKDKPFYIWASGLSPHTSIVRGRTGLPIPAKRHRGTLAYETNPATRKPSYANGVVDGPAPYLSRAGYDKANEKFTTRIESLQAVDEGVRDVVRTLRKTKELRNTYVIFTSDNGYLLGEHGYESKNFLFDEALRVPLMVRVPGMKKPQTSTVPVTAVDIAPTVAALGKVTPERTVDGASFAAALKNNPMAWRDTQLVQTGRIAGSGGDQGWNERGVRTLRWTYGKNVLTGFEQLYDRINDPYELVNLAGRTEYLSVVVELRRRTEALSNCAGATCRVSFGSVPVPGDADEGLLGLPARLADTSQN